MGEKYIGGNLWPSFPDILRKTFRKVIVFVPPQKNVSGAGPCMRPRFCPQKRVRRTTPKNPPNYTGGIWCEKVFTEPAVCFASGGQFLLFKLRRGSISEAHILLFYHLRAGKLLGFYQAVFFGGEELSMAELPCNFWMLKKHRRDLFHRIFCCSQLLGISMACFFQQLDVCLDTFPGWNFPWSFP